MLYFLVASQINLFLPTCLGNTIRNKFTNSSIARIHFAMAVCANVREFFDLGRIYGKSDASKQRKVPLLVTSVPGVRPSSREVGMQLIRKSLAQYSTV